MSIAILVTEFRDRPGLKLQVVVMITAKRLLRSIPSLRTMVTSGPKTKDSSAPRPSASLVVVNSSNEVLLVHRNPKATSYAGMHVRP